MRSFRLSFMQWMVIFLGAIFWITGCGKGGDQQTASSRAQSIKPSLPGLTSSLDTSCSQEVQADLKSALSSGSISSSPSSYNQNGKSCRAACIEVREGPDLFSSTTGALFDFSGNPISSCPDDVSSFMAVHTSKLCNNREFGYRFRYECPADAPAGDMFQTMLFDCGNGTKVSGAQIKQDVELRYVQLQSIYANLRNTVDSSSRVGDAICGGYPSYLAMDGVTFNSRCRGIKVEAHYKAKAGDDITKKLGVPAGWSNIFRMPENSFGVCLRERPAMTNCPDVVFEVGGTQCQ